MLNDEDVNELMDELHPKLAEIMENYTHDEYREVLTAMASFAVFYVGKICGVEAARHLTQSLNENVESIPDYDGDLEVKYDA